MKLVGYLLLGLASTLLAGTIPGGPQPFSLTIDAAQQRIQSGSQVEVKLTLTNSSRTEIILIDSNRWCDYALDVRDSHGQSAPETNYAHQLKCPAGQAGKRIIRALQPGEFFEDEMFVNQFYNLSRPDDYYIQVARKIPKKVGDGTVKSNTITITVAE